jgi:hypothetical protein
MMGATSLLNVGTFFSTDRRFAYCPSADTKASAPTQASDAAKTRILVRICNPMLE